MLRIDYLSFDTSAFTHRLVSLDGTMATHEKSTILEGGASYVAEHDRQALLGTDEQDLWRPMEDWLAD